MKRLLICLFVSGAMLAGYVAAPLATAWSIREAVRTGDTAYLERAIDWPGVRQSLAPSLRQYALHGTTDTPSPAAKLSLWQRIKGYFGAGVVNQAVESYLTPSGLTQLYQLRKSYATHVSGAVDESTLPITERAARAWARIKRAEFTSLTTFEVDMLDKHDPARLYLGTLTLGATGWKMTALRMKVVPVEAPRPSPLDHDAEPDILVDAHETEPNTLDDARTITARPSVLRNFWMGAAQAAEPRRNPLER